MPEEGNEITELASHSQRQSQPLAVEETTSAQARAFYLSHFLTTWNARTYEFAAILFTASSFPDTLFMSSLRGLLTTLATLIFASSIGNAIDLSSTRLKPLILSIAINRLSIAVACLGWLALLQLSQPVDQARPSPHRIWLFAFVVLVGILEKLSGVANMLTSERAWVPAMAESTGNFTLTKLNSSCRRIDLICKLIAPLVISAIISTRSLQYGVWVVGIMSTTSCFIEFATAQYVWNKNAKLRQPNSTSRVTAGPSNTTRTDWMSHTARMVSHELQSLQKYFASDVWLPSIALALLHMSALSYSATFITYLLNVGFTISVITVARTLGSIVEVSSTFVVPIGIQHLAQLKRSPDPDESQAFLMTTDNDEPRTIDHGVGLARSGLWGIFLQLMSLVPVVLAIWQIGTPETPASIVQTATSAPFVNSSTAVTIFAFLSISRLGLWVFDLVVQELTQTRVPATQIASFAGTETALVATCELCQWAIVMIFSKPDQFQYLALGSLGCVLVSATMYSVWVRLQRGHLMHLDKITKSCGCSKP